jgi:site-specific recombinase XerD
VFPLTDRHIANVIKARAKKAGLDPDQFSGHSLRAGFITSAANAGADVFRVMDVSRHRSINTVRGYVRRAKQFDNHAGAGFM